ncbi:MAG: ATP phosphoribosyltransferase regulatory subunit [Acidobacteria bacterium 13_1_40CM_2_56_11]|nr:MAG: ATP phosphoribosyltransferase regulatory subunit [Acidobacteria bacterium 13_1_40CM_2_56_11]
MSAASYAQIPPGTQIVIGRAARRRRVLERTICSVFEGWSYEEIIPPIFDYYDVFVKGMGTGPEEQIYRFIDREGNILALRPEFTSLVAKTVATRLASSPKPIRLYYSGEVLRFEKPKGGRQREFAQIGIEHYGASGKTADVEILLIAVETFQRLGIQAFQINLGSVDFFGGIVDRMELPADRIAELKDVLNVKDRSGLEALLEKLPLGDRRKKILRAVPHLTGGKAVIAEARELVRNPRSVEALDHLEEIYSIFQRLDLAQHLTIDLGEIRGFDYYSGILFRAYVRDLGFEVASGGRYDGLPGAFGEDLPAVGFSFSVDRLEQIVTPEIAEVEAASIDVDDGFDEALQLRRSGKAVRLCL